MKRPTDKTFTEHIDDLGEFTFRYTTLMDEIQIDNLTNQLLRGNDGASVTAANIATMIATLKVSIVKAPDAFKIDDLYNYDELKAIYDCYSAKVFAFRFNRKDKDGSAEPSANV